MVKGSKVDPSSYPQLLRKGDMAKVVVALAQSRGDAGFTDEEAAKILLWAEWIAFQWHMLQLVLKGMVIPDFKNDNRNSFEDITFQSVLLTLGPSATEAYMQLLKRAETSAEASKDPIPEHSDNIV